MTEIHPNLHLGNASDYEHYIAGREDWRIVQLAKDPYHREAVGYTTKSLPSSHPEYYLAVRGSRLILNMVDAPDPKYIHKPSVDTALAFIRDSLASGNKVLVHCNQGRSRTSLLGMLFLASQNKLPPTLLAAEKAFSSLYPPCQLGKGMRAFLQEHFSSYLPV